MNKWIKLCFLILGGGTIFKLSSMKDVFYVPMQADWGLTNTQIGFGFTVYAIVQTIGLFSSLYIADRFSKKILLPVGLIGVGLCGAYLTTLPSFSGYLIAFGAMAFFGEVVYWPVLLKAVRLLGTRDEQGRMFGFLEAGRGVVDVLIASGALFVFVHFGEGKTGMQAGLVYYTLVTILVGIITYFIVDSDDRSSSRDVEDVNKQVFTGIKNVIKSPNLWLASFCIFFVYSAYCGLTYFIPFLKDIYALPVALVGAYGIINQYGLKMVGGPVGGFLADKIAHSPVIYLKWTFLISAIAMLLFIQLPHDSMNVYLGMAATLGFGAIIFSQRAIFFAPMDEIGTPREFAGSAMAFGCIIGYMPSMFAYTLYGSLLDNFSGIQGYNYVFSVMVAFSLLGFVCATLLTRRMRIKK
ncbi:MFS transporter [Salmonella enterica subsp. enterica serovar Oranienburg]|uniref:MFS transporter n=1 Tax=Salmonella enterica TaxID=28901 RepID=A0A403N4U3_SALER|nr:MFS transporter [Salmonella enterica]EAA5624353.1 MFS transporter [Salmonella enterica subsp. enterica serovar Tennessee]EBQ9534415.1 MFS transporter [Salmonella enterica subsp. enterica serovar Muenster]EBR9059931.1 MFS transporter [Salmonella enterica subsp. enterica serovar Koketime]EBU8756909.1 MFS transporter [Salmonella enterica subsp. enterica serovar Offa]EBV0858417.1 MFS transporter [Salmonella enterica subsp. enterica serovar Anecho]EBY1132875.1 MFS transporter [Salmonella enteri